MCVHVVGMRQNLRVRVCMTMRLCVQVDCQTGEDADFDGVACFDHVHKDYVTSVMWASHPGSSSTATNHLLSTSYDGSIRLLDVGEVRCSQFFFHLQLQQATSACASRGHRKWSKANASRTRTVWSALQPFA
jgi:hypothetical protein